jgi:hypothetical protein
MAPVDGTSAGYRSEMTEADIKGRHAKIVRQIYE